MKKHHILLTVLLFSLSCSGENSRNRDTVPDCTAVIFHINDTHGKIENFPRLAWLINQYKKTNSYVTAVSAGDAFSGDPAVDLYTPPGYPIIDLMEQCGFSVSAIGNHEFDYGQPVLASYMTGSSIRFISANMDCSGAELPQPDAAATVILGPDEAPLRIHFIGVTERNSDGIPSTRPANIIGITFSDPAAAITKARPLDLLPGEPVIALTHVGYSTDRYIAQANPWLHAVIGGHSHSLVGGSTNLPVVTQAGSKLTMTGILTLTIRNGSVQSVRSTLRLLDDTLQEDPVVKSAVNSYLNNPMLEQAPGELSAELYGKEQLGSLMTDGMRYATGVDAAFQNDGGIRVSYLNQGPLTLQEIYTMDPFNNEIIVYNLNLTQLSNFLRSAKETLRVSGIKYSRSGRALSYADLPLTDRIYRIAVNSYTAETTSALSGIQSSNTGMTTEEALIHYISNTTPLGIPEHSPRILD